jgi:hypothetical protein
VRECVCVGEQRVDVDVHEWECVCGVHDVDVHKCVYGVQDVVVCVCMCVYVLV